MTAANTPDLRALVERLRAMEPKGQFQIGGGSICKDGKCEIWGGEPFLRFRNPDGPQAAALIESLQHRVAEMEAVLSASIGYMTNAKIDLQTGCPKATAIRTIEGGIAKARSTLKDRGEGR